MLIFVSGEELFLVSSGPTQVLTRVYFNEGVFERQIKKVQGERRCKSMEALYLGPLGLLYKVQVLHENFLWGAEGLVSHMEGLETENQ
jgi:hypothetical protein